MWANGHFLGEHRGGYTPFSFDVTSALSAQSPTGHQQTKQKATRKTRTSPPTQQTLTITLRASDDPHDLAAARQAGLACPAAWHLVSANDRHLADGLARSACRARTSASCSGRRASRDWNFKLCDVALDARWPSGLSCVCACRTRDKLLVDDTYSCTDIESHARIYLPDPGIDDARHDISGFRTPEAHRRTLELLDADGELLDTVKSYTAMRSVQCEGPALHPEQPPVVLRLVLDQGYWADGGLTATGRRRPQARRGTRQGSASTACASTRRSRDPRFLYWCDRLGLLVWEEMPSPYRFARQTVRRLSQTWQEVDRARRLASVHRGVGAVQRIVGRAGSHRIRTSSAHFVKRLYYLTHSARSHPPVIGNDGWELVVSDMLSIHDYRATRTKLLERYADDAGAWTALLARAAAGGPPAGDRRHSPPRAIPVMLTEFGGIAFRKADTKEQAGATARRADAQDFLAHYAALIAAVHACRGLAGSATPNSPTPTRKSTA